MNQPGGALQLGSKIMIAPVIHGSGDFAIAVRRLMLQQSFDCLAVPLPPSFRQDVESAIENLPAPTLVVQREPAEFDTEWSPEKDATDDDAEDDRSASYVPIDPCQGVITALRVAMGEHMPRAFIDCETARFRPASSMMPDPYALKQVSLERFATAVLPSIRRPDRDQMPHRIPYMARRLRELEERFESILFICSILDWPWIREAYRERLDETVGDDNVEPTSILSPEPETLMFALGEMPFITGLYERAREVLDDDENLSVDGVKQLLLAARESYMEEMRGRGRRITPFLLSQCLKYIRNLSLIDRRFTPDLYTIATAAKQTLGDRFALHVVEQSREYPYCEYVGFPRMRMGVDAAVLDDGEVYDMHSRLPGVPVTWRSCELQPRPLEYDRREWRMRWNPFAQCSWPPEDDRVEHFREAVFSRAKEMMGEDLVKTEPFTTSIKDGVDIRDTLRNWHTGDIYVKEIPPSRGKLDCAVMLFDSPADPRDYPWRATWYAEHSEESTLAFYATDFHQDMIGPGIGVGTYGGAMFLFPPVAIPDIWNNPALDFTETLEERLLAAACLHSECPRIALLSSAPPGVGWNRLAKRFGKKWLHVPMARFSDETVQRLRMVHVLNGREVRSYAAHFIRDP